MFKMCLKVVLRTWVIRSEEFFIYIEKPYLKWWSEVWWLDHILWAILQSGGRWSYWSLHIFCWIWAECQGSLDWLTPSSTSYGFNRKSGKKCWFQLSLEESLHSVMAELRRGHRKSPGGRGDSAAGSACNIGIQVMGMKWKPQESR